MRTNPIALIGALPWNTRDRYRCVHCAQFVCINDHYCRCCGDFICNKEKQLMRANLTELANKNLPSLIGCLGFVIAVVALLILYY